MFLCILVGATAAQAIENPALRVQSPQAQTMTIRALQSIDQNQWTIGRNTIAATKDPLAAKLYYWLEFTQKNDVTNYTRLTQFIRNNPEWPGMTGLKVKAERNMPRTISNEEVIEWFRDYPPQTANGLDRYLSALLILGREPEAQKIIRDWWSQALSTRDEQKHLYSRYGGMIDHATHRKRLDALLFSQQYSNARAIADVLGKGYPELTEARIALAADKGDVNALIDKVPTSLKNDPGLRYERLKWRRVNDYDDGAIEILRNAPAYEDMQNPAEWWRERHIIIRRLMEQKKFKAAYFLAKDHKQKEGFAYAQAEWMAGWLALRFENKPTEAYQRFEALYQNVETPISKARAAYWAGRAAEAFNNIEIAQKWYRDAARFQTVYYGQLAGAKLGIKESLPNAAPPVLSALENEQFARNELMQAALLFHKAGMEQESTRFLYAFVDHIGTPTAYLYAAQTAANLNNYADAVRISKDATNEGLFLTAQSYPVITSQLRDIQVEWALVHGLIRQESMFDLNARSPVGALGLMQLMPATAKETARKLNVSHQDSWLTLRPSHNILLGSAYLDQMLRRFDNSYPLAIAAYNAGPGRVDNWLETFGDPRKGDVDWIDWLEMMPIYETRNYVQRVMEAVYVYRLRLNGVQKGHEYPIHIALAR